MMHGRRVDRMKRMRERRVLRFHTPPKRATSVDIILAMKDYFVSLRMKILALDGKM